jgi:class 3 adenylate cyclase
MATFPAPDRALAAALRMRAAMDQLNAKRGGQDLLLKIGIHEGPCLAVMLNDRQDFFGQTVNIASRVQHLAVSQAIFASDSVVTDPSGSALLTRSGVEPVPHRTALRGISHEYQVYELPVGRLASTDRAAI